MTCLSPRGGNSSSQVARNHKAFFTIPSPLWLHGLLLGSDGGACVLEACTEMAHICSAAFPGPEQTLPTSHSILGRRARTRPGHPPPLVPAVGSRDVIWSVLTEDTEELYATAPG